MQCKYSEVFPIQDDAAKTRVRGETDIGDSVKWETSAALVNLKSNRGLTYVLGILYMQSLQIRFYNTMVRWFNLRYMLKYACNYLNVIEFHNS